MIKATFKKKTNGMRCVHVYRDGSQIGHREFKSGKMAKAYARMYDKDFKRI